MAINEGEFQGGTMIDRQIETLDSARDRLTAEVEKFVLNPSAANLARFDVARMISSIDFFNLISLVCELDASGSSKADTLDVFHAEEIKARIDIINSVLAEDVLSFNKERALFDEDLEAVVDSLDTAQWQTIGQALYLGYENGSTRDFNNVLGKVGLTYLFRQPDISVFSDS
ncbi:MAG TPA: hypothetical protein VFT49_04300 [Candidatus Saccharimonadales bacterium]|nr:hypothetical protein [Candidatus Saccharimonadales bacterium]